MCAYLDVVLDGRGPTGRRQGASARGVPRCGSPRSEGRIQVPGGSYLSTAARLDKLSSSTRPRVRCRRRSRGSCVGHTLVVAPLVDNVSKCCLRVYLITAVLVGDAGPLPPLQVRAVPIRRRCMGHPR